ncbi:MAG: hypothetical protein JJ896_02730 [Rhodothermales bacterium]|nr:hypothetical protein [Rhodothermales bacterium]
MPPDLFRDLFVDPELLPQVQEGWLELFPGSMSGYDSSWNAGPAGSIKGVLWAASKWLPKARIGIDLSGWSCRGCGYASFLSMLCRVLDHTNRPTFEEKILPYVESLRDDPDFAVNAEAALPLVVRLHSPSARLLDQLEYYHERKRVMEFAIGLRWWGQST